jgi:hypothetical protein
MSVAVLNPTLDHVLVTAGIVWLIARQFTWRDVSDLLRWPVLLLAFGAISATLGVLHGERSCRVRRRAASRCSHGNSHGNSLPVS